MGNSAMRRPSYTSSTSSGSLGKLNEEIPMPSLLADPYHHVKVVAKHIFKIVNNGKAQQCGYTKADALRINKC